MWAKVNVRKKSMTRYNSNAIEFINVHFMFYEGGTHTVFFIEDDKHYNISVIPVGPPYFPGNIFQKSFSENWFFRKVPKICMKIPQKKSEKMRTTSVSV